MMLVVIDITLYANLFHCHCLYTSCVDVLDQISLINHNGIAEITVRLKEVTSNKNHSFTEKL